MQSLEMQFKEVIIEMSHNCNLSCQMCGFGFRPNPTKKEKFISDESFRKYVDILAPHTTTLRLNGRGESIIHPHFTDLLEWTHNKYPELRLNLFTNASLKKDGLISTLVRCNVQIFISFDSVCKSILEKIRYGCNYETVVNNIKGFDQSPIRPFLIATLQDDNITEIEPLARFALDNQCSMIYNTVRSDDENSVSHFHKYVGDNIESISNAFDKAARLFEDTGLQCLIPDQIGGIAIKSGYASKSHGTMSHCPAIDNELCVLYDGTVTPCNMFNPYTYGNLSEMTLPELLSDIKYANFKRLYKKHYYCKNCANLGV